MKMVIFYTAVAWCVLSLVYADQNFSIGTITVIGQDIELAGSGALDLQNTRDMDALLSVIYELCDGYNTCNKSGLVPDHFNMFPECCVPCDCSDDCFAVGNCCGDKVGEPRRTMSGEIVSERGEVCSMIRHPRDGNITISYMLVTQCHPEFQGEARDICHKANGTTLDELTPVYSNQTGLTYRNVHCARCNYQTQSLTPWHMSMACQSYAPMFPDGIIGPAIKGGCQFNWMPNNLVAQCYRRSGPDECLAVKYRTLCDTVPAGYGYALELWERACTHCGLPMGNVCPPTSVYRFPPYQVLLNWDIYAAPQPPVSELLLDHKESEAVCQDAERLNDFEPRCLRLWCPPSQITRNTREHKCIDVYDMVKGLCLEYRLRVTMATGVATELVISEVINAIFSAYVLPDLLTTEVIEVIDHSATHNSVTYSMRVVEDWQHNLINVLLRFQQFEESCQDACTTHGVGIEPDTTGLAFMPQPSEEIGYLSYADNLTTDGCQKTVAMNKIQFCEMVMFSPEEYSIRSVAVVLRDGREFHPHEYVFRESRDGSRHVQVCLNTYRSRYSMIHSGSSVTAYEIALLINLILDQFLLQLFINP